jgi:hypothetical protein
VALVVDLQGLRREAGLQGLPDLLEPFLVHGRTLMKGLTSVLEKTPAAT